MLQTIHKSLPVLRVPALPILSTVSALAFGWLLISDSIQPIVIYLLQIYLAF